MRTTLRDEEPAKLHRGVALPVLQLARSLRPLTWPASPIVYVVITPSTYNNRYGRRLAGVPASLHRLESPAARRSAAVVEVTVNRSCR